MERRSGMMVLEGRMIECIHGKQDRDNYVWEQSKEKDSMERKETGFVGDDVDDVPKLLLKLKQRG